MSWLLLFYCTNIPQFCFCLQFIYKYICTSLFSTFHWWVGFFLAENASQKIQLYNPDQIKSSWADFEAFLRWGFHDFFILVKVWAFSFSFFVLVSTFLLCQFFFLGFWIGFNCGNLGCKNWASKRLLKDHIEFDRSELKFFVKKKWEISHLVLVKMGYK